MEKKALHNVVLCAGVLREGGPDDSRIVLWLPGSRDQAYQYWQRVGTTQRPDSINDDIVAAPAALIPAHQPVRGFFGSLLQRLRRPSQEQSWTLPHGPTAEQCGERQTDLMLVWSEAGPGVLDQARIKSHWPQSKRIEKIGDRVFLLWGAGRPWRQVFNVAEKMLAAARAAGDRRREAVVLGDLGVMSLRENDAAGASARLEEALTIAGQLGDRKVQSDIQGNLGMALLALRQRERAKRLFEEQLTHARETGDPMAEKLALERLGLASWSLGDSPRAVAFFEEALALTRAAGDRDQEADLLWLLAMHYAEQGLRDQGIASAQAAVDLLERMGKPEARVFAEHLRKFRLGEPVAPLASATSAAAFAVSMVASVGQPGAPPAGVSGPGVLRLGFAAAKSLAHFVGSGFRTVSGEARDKRLQTCAGCVHHTGLRCKVCGCFTDLKSRLVHENCPIGKWPG